MFVIHILSDESVRLYGAIRIDLVITIKFGKEYIIINVHILKVSYLVLIK